MMRGHPCTYTLSQRRSVLVASLHSDCVFFLSISLALFIRAALCCITSLALTFTNQIVPYVAEATDVVFRASKSNDVSIDASGCHTPVFCFPSRCCAFASHAFNQLYIFDNLFSAIQHISACCAICLRGCFAASSVAHVHFVHVHLSRLNLFAFV